MLKQKIDRESLALSLVLATAFGLPGAGLLYDFLPIPDPGRAVCGQQLMDPGDTCTLVGLHSVEGGRATFSYDEMARHASDMSTGAEIFVYIGLALIAVGFLVGLASFLSEARRFAREATAPAPPVTSRAAPQFGARE